MGRETVRRRAPWLSASYAGRGQGSWASQEREVQASCAESAPSGSPWQRHILGEPERGSERVVGGTHVASAFRVSARGGGVVLVCTHTHALSLACEAPWDRGTWSGVRGTLGTGVLQVRAELAFPAMVTLPSRPLLHGPLFPVCGCGEQVWTPSGEPRPCSPFLQACGLTASRQASRAALAGRVVLQAQDRGASVRSAALALAAPRPAEAPSPPVQWGQVWQPPPWPVRVQSGLLR